MARICNNPMEKIRMNIELADNGIIIRDPDCEDNVTLALDGKGQHRIGEYGYDIDHSDVYKAIGKKVYDWLLDVVIQEHQDFITTNFDIDIIATCKGRERI